MKQNIIDGRQKMKPSKELRRAVVMLGHSQLDCLFRGKVVTCLDTMQNVEVRLVIPDVDLNNVQEIIEEIEEYSSIH